MFTYKEVLVLFLLYKISNAVYVYEENSDEKNYSGENYSNEDISHENYSNEASFDDDDLYRDSPEEDNDCPEPSHIENGSIWLLSYWQIRQKIKKNDLFDRLLQANASMFKVGYIGDMELEDYDCALKLIEFGIHWHDEDGSHKQLFFKIVQMRITVTFSISNNNSIIACNEYDLNGVFHVLPHAVFGGNTLEISDNPNTLYFKEKRSYNLSLVAIKKGLATGINSLESTDFIGAPNMTFVKVDKCGHNGDPNTLRGFIFGGYYYSVKNSSMTVFYVASLVLLIGIVLAGAVTSSIVVFKKVQNLTKNGVKRNQVVPVNTCPY